MTTTIHTGDALAVLRTLPDASVNCVVTSPPYYGLRDYGHGDQIGLEETPAQYVAALAAVFEQVRRVLRDDGVMFLNLGDSYSSGTIGRNEDYSGASNLKDDGRPNPGANGYERAQPAAIASRGGLPPKNLIGIPWRVAFALQDAGWYLRSDIIWHKPNPMPESVTDRPTKSHEHVFLLTKSARYWYDAGAIREPNSSNSGRYGAFNGSATAGAQAETGGAHGASSGLTAQMTREEYTEKYYTNGRNARTVWTIPTQPYPGAHYAVMPPALAERCILAGCPEKVCAACGRPYEPIVERTAMQVRPGPSRAERSENGRLRTQINGTMTAPPTSRVTGYEPACSCAADTARGTVLDPFGGHGTTALVADRLGRHAVLIELNPDNAQAAADRLRNDAPMFADVRMAGHAMPAHT